MGFKSIIVESDAATILDMLKSTIIAHNHLLPLLLDCRNLLDRPWAVDLRSIYREGNCLADVIAKNACNQPDVFCCFSVPPMYALKSFEEDNVGRATPQCVAHN